MTATTLPEYLIIGQIGKPYALKGWLRLRSFSTPENQILNYNPLFFQEKQGNWRLLENIKLRENSQGLLIHIEGCDTPEAAKRYTLAHVGIERSQLLPTQPGEYYWHDFIGLTVINHEGITLGTITDLLEVGEHDVLVVKGEREHLIPVIHHDVILNIDLAHRLIAVRWDADF